MALFAERRPLGYHVTTSRTKFPLAASNAAAKSLCLRVAIRAEEAQIFEPIVGVHTVYVIKM